MASATGTSDDPIDLTGDGESDFGDEVVTISSKVEPATQTFTLFPKLPPELRCRIWKNALPGRRFVQIDRQPYQMLFNRDDSGYIPTVIWRPRCIERAPSIFWVCRESKAEVCKIFKPLKGTEPQSPVIWCDFAIDYMCIPFMGAYTREPSSPSMLMATLSAELLATIRFLAVDAEMGASIGLDMFPNFKLKELALCYRYEEFGRANKQIIVDFKDEMPDRMHVWTGGDWQNIRTAVERLIKGVVAKHPDWTAPLITYGRAITADKDSV